jgi:hypothetical protein
MGRLGEFNRVLETPELQERFGDYTRLLANDILIRRPEHDYTLIPTQDDICYLELGPEPPFPHLPKCLKCVDQVDCPKCNGDRWIRHRDYVRDLTVREMCDVCWGRGLCDCDGSHLHDILLRGLEIGP